MIKYIPWWFFLIIACSVYFLFPTNDFLTLMEKININSSVNLINVNFYLFLLFTFYSLYVAYIQYTQTSLHYLILKASSIDGLYQLQWDEFENLVEEILLNSGFSVEKHGGNHADGGIDLIAYEQESKIIVQCKHWQGQVGVKTIREMYGIMHHEKAQEVFVFGTGGFTKEARKFAEGKPISLYQDKDIVHWCQNLDKI